jgi:multisubunit Na+/H+ antiporter MnhG subunit
VLAQVWGRFNANEKLATMGAGLVILAFLLGFVFSGGLLGYGTGVLVLLGAIALPVIYYLKYAPDTKVTWPAPVPVIAFVIGAVVGLIGLISLIQMVQWFGWLSFNVTWLIAPIISIVGCGVMAWGTYKEWAATRTTAS